MKITVDVELQESEASCADQIVEVLRSYCTNVVAQVRTDKGALRQLIHDSLLGGKIDAVSAEVARRLGHPQLSEECEEVFLSLIFDTKRVESGESVTNYINVILRLPDPLRAKVREDVIQSCLKFLTISRRLDAPREPILPYGEALGGMVKADLLSARGILNTIISLIRGDNTRCAGITALGKVVELASDVLITCDTAILELLRSTLSAAQDDYYMYDIEYITEPFGWSQTQKGNGALALQRSSRHHTSPILAMAYSGGQNTREVLVTSSGDGTIATWDGQGTLVENCVLARHYACSVDLACRGHALVLSGVGRHPTIPPAVVYYTEEQGRWVEKGAIEPEGARVVSAVRSLRTPNTFQFCTGEAGINITLGLYDVARPRAIKQYRDHTDVITTLYTPEQRENLVISGSRDCSVILYDLRLPAAVQIATHHFSTVTSIAGFDNNIITAGLDKRIVVHDIRMFHQAVAHRDFDSGVLKMSLGPQGLCVLSTLTNLYMVSLSSPQLVTSKAEGITGRYYDIAWNHNQSLVFAGGDSMMLDVFASTFAQQQA